jgi:prevent-host-death family protein
MITVSAAEFQRHFGRYQDEALVQPVAITRNGRERLVVLSTEEYHRLRRQSREVLRAGDLTDAELDQIAKIEKDPRHQEIDPNLNGRCRFPLRSPVWSSGTAIAGIPDTSRAAETGTRAAPAPSFSPRQRARKSSSLPRR